MRVLPRPIAILAAVAVSAAGALALPAAPAYADEIRDRSWHLGALEVAELHQITQGEGVTVAVVDTGVDAAHPDLTGNVLPGVDLYGDSKGQVDRRGHGTEMASLIAGHGHGPGNGDGVLGIAPRAKILPVTIQGAGNTGIAPDAIAAGIDWAVDNGADVINVSLWSPHSASLDRAVERAWSKNVLVVAAVGNRENGVIGNPARHSAVLAVSGSDRTGGFGSESITALETDLAAPSVDLPRARPGGGYSTSTSVSAATAIVSGAVALVRARHPDLNLESLFKRMVETAKDAGQPGRDERFGWGVLDLRQALTGEPDGRMTRAVEPESTYAGLDPKEQEREWWVPLAEWSPVIVLLLIVVLVIVLLVRRRRRKRAGTAGGGVPPPSTMPPPAPPTQSTNPADETVWRPPGR